MMCGPLTTHWLSAVGFVAYGSVLLAPLSPLSMWATPTVFGFGGSFLFIQASPQACHSLSRHIESPARSSMHIHPLVPARTSVKTLQLQHLVGDELRGDAHTGERLHRSLDPEREGLRRRLGGGGLRTQPEPVHPRSRVDSSFRVGHSSSPPASGECNAETPLAAAVHPCLNGMKDFTDCCPTCSSPAYFARFQTTVAVPPPDAPAAVYRSWSPLMVNGRFCSVPLQLGNVAASILKVKVLSAALTDKVPKWARLPATIALFSSAVAVVRLLEATLGRSVRENAIT